MKSIKTANTNRTPPQDRLATKEELEANRYLVSAINTYRKRHGISQNQLKKRLLLAQKSQAHISRRLSMRHETDAPIFLSELMTFYEAMSYCSAMETSLDNVLKEYKRTLAEKVPNYQGALRIFQKILILFQSLKALFLRALLLFWNLVNLFRKIFRLYFRPAFSSAATVLQTVSKIPCFNVGLVYSIAIFIVHYQLRTDAFMVL